MWVGIHADLSLADRGRRHKWRPTGRSEFPGHVHAPGARLAVVRRDRTQARKVDAEGVVFLVAAGCAPTAPHAACRSTAPRSRCRDAHSRSCALSARCDRRCRGRTRPGCRRWWATSAAAAVSSCQNTSTCAMKSAQSVLANTQSPTSESWSSAALLRCAMSSVSMQVFRKAPVPHWGGYSSKSPSMCAQLAASSRLSVWRPLQLELRAPALGLARVAREGRRLAAVAHLDHPDLHVVEDVAEDRRVHAQPAREDVGFHAELPLLDRFLLDRVVVDLAVVAAAAVAGGPAQEHVGVVGEPGRPASRCRCRC